ncbi:MAG: NAD-dependent epimerase/dehydratase family protein [Hyphomicrobiaceae bacterium]
MNILVTGANGFLGRHVVSSLLEVADVDTRIRCLVRVGSNLHGLDRLDVEVFRGSLDDESAYQEMLDGIDVVVHLAASMGGSPMGMFAETVVSTEKLVRHVNRSRVSRFVFCSSFSVYGASQLKAGAVFDERCPIEPNPTKRDSYAWCKYYQELWVKEKLDEAGLVVVRPGVIYGEGQGLLSSRVGLQLPGLPVFLRIGGRARLPLIHVANCADLIARATVRTDIKSEVFNAVDDECPTQSDYMAMYEGVCGKVPRKLWLPYPLFWLASACYDGLHRLSKGNFPAIFSPYKARSMYRPFEYSNGKAKTLLNWQPRVSLREGLEASAAVVKTGKV